MGQVNSQGLTWLEWLATVGHTPKHNGICAKPWYEMRQAWKAGVDPELYRTVKNGESEYDRRHGRTLSDGSRDPETGLGYMQGRKGF